jgi:hypothetical protein
MWLRIGPKKTPGAKLLTSTVSRSSKEEQRGQRESLRRHSDGATARDRAPPLVRDQIRTKCSPAASGKLR